jgi:hypothetical protein
MKRLAGILLILLTPFACPIADCAAETKRVEHPFILWTKDDIARMRRTYRAESWLQESLARLDASRGKPLANLFRYAVLGDEEAGAGAKKKLLETVWSPAPRGAAQWITVLRYDLLYDDLTPDERRDCERCFREYIHNHVFERIIFDESKFANPGNYRRYDAREYTRTNWLPNIIWPWKVSANLMAVALRDEELIRKTWGAYGSWKWYFDEYLCDSGFYSEEFSKMKSTPGAMIVYCLGVERLGLNELGFGYTGTGGASMRGHLESVIHLGYPRVDLGTSRPHYPTVTIGDLRHRQFFHEGHSVQGYCFQDSTAKGYGRQGDGGRPRWLTAGAWGGTRRTKRPPAPPWDIGKTPKMNIPLWFELGYGRWPEAGFGYFLSQMRAPDQASYVPSPLFGLDPISPTDVTPPAAPSAVWPQRGLIMLRAEESPEYWESEAPAVCMRTASPYAHDVNDSFALAGLYAFNRPIYINRQTCSSYAEGVSRSIRSHAGIQVDDREPVSTYETTVRSDFAPTVKFAAARSKAVYEGVDFTRSLMLTRDYLLDVTVLKADEPHDYCWRVHAIGPAADPRKLDPGDDAWSVTVQQSCPTGDAGKTLLGRAWYGKQIGVRLTMLGGAKTSVKVEDTPPLESHPRRPPPPRDEIGGTTISATRRGNATVFAALHEPFRNGKPRVVEIQPLMQTNDTLAIAVTGHPNSGIDDRLMLRFGDEADQPVTFQNDSERFTFARHAFVRVGTKTVDATGDLREMKIRVLAGSRPRLTVHEKPTPATVADGFLVYQK